MWHGLSLFLHAFAVCHLVFQCLWEGGTTCLYRCGRSRWDDSTCTCGEWGAGKNGRRQSSSRVHGSIIFTSRLRPGPTMSQSLAFCPKPVPLQTSLNRSISGKLRPTLWRSPKNCWIDTTCEAIWGVNFFCLNTLTFSKRVATFNSWPDTRALISCQLSSWFKLHERTRCADSELHNFESQGQSKHYKHEHCNKHLDPCEMFCNIGQSPRWSIRLLDYASAVQSWYNILAERERQIEPALKCVFNRSRSKMHHTSDSLDWRCVFLWLKLQMNERDIATCSSQVHYFDDFAKSFLCSGAQTW